MDHLPELPSSTGKNALVVVLVRLDAHETDRLKAKLSRDFVDDSETGLLFTHCKPGEAQKKTELYEQTGCVHAIHILCQQAEDLGLNCFYLFDQDSKIQLDDASSKIELGALIRGTSTRWLYRRTSSSVAIPGDPLPYSFDLTRRWSAMESLVHAEGIPINPLDQPFFKNYNSPLTPTPLPPEPSHDASQDTPLEVPEHASQKTWTKAPRTLWPSEAAIPVQSFSPMDREKRERSQTELKKATGDKITFKIYSWRRDSQGHRGDYWNLHWAGYEICFIFYDSLWEEKGCLLQVETLPSEHSPRPYPGRIITQIRPDWISRETWHSPWSVSVPGGEAVLNEQMELLLDPTRRPWLVKGKRSDDMPVLIRTAGFTSHRLEKLSKDLRSGDPDEELDPWFDDIQLTVHLHLQKARFTANGLLSLYCRSGIDGNIRDNYFKVDNFVMVDDDCHSHGTVWLVSLKDDGIDYEGYENQKQFFSCTRFAAKKMYSLWLDLCNCVVYESDVAEVHPIRDRKELRLEDYGAPTGEFTPEAIWSPKVALWCFSNFV